MTFSVHNWDVQWRKKQDLLFWYKMGVCGYSKLGLGTCKLLQIPNYPLILEKLTICK